MSPITTTKNIPEEEFEKYIDSISKQIFAEPVFTTAGDTYEGEAIKNWLEKYNTNPLDNAELTNKALFPNNDKLRDVNKFLDKYPELRNSDELYLPRHWVKELETACINNKLTDIQRFCGRDPRLGSWTFTFEEKEYAAYKGKTMLHLACAQGTAKAIDYLIAIEEKRAEGLGLLLLLKKDNDGKLPIHYAMARAQDPQIMRKLATQMGKHLAKVAPENKITALHLAAMNDDIATVSILLEQKADLTAKDNQGNTPLFAAIACGADKAAALLRNVLEPQHHHNIWQPIQYLQTPSELRNAVIEGLTSHPLIQEAKMMYWDEKKSIREFKQMERINISPWLNGKQIETLIKVFPDGRLLCLLSNQGFAVINAFSGKVIQLPVQKYQDYSTTGERLVIEYESKIGVWDIQQETYRELKSYKPTVDKAVYYNFQKFITGFTDGRIGILEHVNTYPKGTYTCHNIIKILDTVHDICTPLATLSTPHSRYYALPIHMITPDGRFLLAEYDNTLNMWQIDNGQLTKLLKLKEPNDELLSLDLFLSNRYVVSRMRYDPCDRGKPHSLTSKYFLKTWNIIEKKCESIIETPPRISQLFALSNGLVTGICSDNHFTKYSIKTWNVITNEHISTINLDGSVQGPIVSNTNLLLGVSADHLNIWDVSMSKVCTTTFAKCEEFSNPMLLLADGRIISRTNTHSFRLWQCGGQALSLKLGFWSGLLAAYPNFTIKKETGSVQVQTDLPCEAELINLATTLQTICPDHKLTTAITATTLTIEGGNSELRKDFERLFQAMHISKSLVQPKRNALTSLIIKVGNLFTAPYSYSPPSPVTTASSSSSTSSSSSISSSSSSST